MRIASDPPVAVDEAVAWALALALAPATNLRTALDASVEPVEPVEPVESGAWVTAVLPASSDVPAPEGSMASRDAFTKRVLAPAGCPASATVS
ncbi:MAG TPA: hypothetical protein VMV22_07015 [Acidimicrobiales bacterium]|nr:hypothetical protein [Acidimicrobiales bacterium]